MWAKRTFAFAHNFSRRVYTHILHTLDKIKQYVFVSRSRRNVSTSLLRNITSIFAVFYAPACPCVRKATTAESAKDVVVRVLALCAFTTGELALCARAHRFHFEIKRLCGCTPRVPVDSLTRARSAHALAFICRRIKLHAFDKKSTRTQITTATRRRAQSAHTP